MRTLNFRLATPRLKAINSRSYNSACCLNLHAFCHQQIFPFFSLGNSLIWVHIVRNIAGADQGFLDGGLIFTKGGGGLIG